MRVQTSQGIVLLYLLIISMMLICHVAARPRVEYELISCQKCKFLCSWIPFLILVLFCQAYAVIETKFAYDFESGWLTLLEQSQAISKECTDASLMIDIDKLVKDRDNKSGFDGTAGMIMVLGSANVILIALQFLMHYKMLMRWYRENPLMSIKLVRSIKVGIMPEPRLDSEQSPQQGISQGQIVPEADR